MNKFLNRIIIIIFITFSVIILSYTALYFSIHWLIKYSSDQHFGEIPINDEYEVVKIHPGESNLIARKGPSLDINGNILQVGWNKRYIFYLTDEGYFSLDMKSRESEIFNQDQLSNHLKKALNFGVINIKDVKDLYPETR